MQTNHCKRLAMAAGLVGSLTLSGTSYAVPFEVPAGFDLLFTDSATFDLGPSGIQPFEGVPLGSFDFGGGPVNVGNTDTIVERLEDATRPANNAGPADENPIDIEIVALSLMSVDPVDFTFAGGNANEHVMTMNVTDLGSTMTIEFDGSGTGGNFSSALNFSVDIVGVDSGAALTQTFNLTQGPDPWSMECPPGKIQIPGVNDDFCTGVDPVTGEIVAVSHHFPTDPGDHTVVPADTVIPAPTSLLLMLPGLGLLAAARRRHH